MKINVSLSTESIDSAIEELQAFAELLEEGTEQVVEILTNKGAEVAQAAYGDFPVEAVPLPEGTTGTIIVAGDMPLIAEFGAGDATSPTGFENVPGEVYAGSYSEEHAKQYSTYGFWHFGGERYTEVPARHGLLDAKQYIIENSTNVAREVFASD